MENMLMISRESIELSYQGACNAIAKGRLTENSEIEFTKGFRDAAKSLLDASVMNGEGDEKILYFAESFFNLLSQTAQKYIDNAREYAEKNGVRIDEEIAYYEGMKHYVDKTIADCKIFSDEEAEDASQDS